METSVSSLTGLSIMRFYSLLAFCCLLPAVAFRDYDYLGCWCAAERILNSTRQVTVYAYCFSHRFERKHRGGF